MRELSHFEFSDGSNPYITFTEAARQNMMRRCSRRGWVVQKLNKGFFRVICENRKEQA